MHNAIMIKPRACRSRELRCGIMYTTCECIKRNGLQDKCPRAACQGLSACMSFPVPSCCPANMTMGVNCARMRCSDPCQPRGCCPSPCCGPSSPPCGAPCPSLCSACTPSSCPPICEDGIPDPRVWNSCNTPQAYPSKCMCCLINGEPECCLQQQCSTQPEEEECEDCCPMSICCNDRRCEKGSDYYGEQQASHCNAHHSMQINCADTCCGLNPTSDPNASCNFNHSSNLASYSQPLYGFGTNEDYLPRPPCYFPFTESNTQSTHCWNSPGGIKISECNPHPTYHNQPPDNRTCKYPIPDCSSCVDKQKCCNSMNMCCPEETCECCDATTNCCCVNTIPISCPSDRCNCVARLNYYCSRNQTRPSSANAAKNCQETRNSTVNKNDDRSSLLCCQKVCKDILAEPMTSPTEKGDVLNSSQLEAQPEYKQMSTNTQRVNGTTCACYEKNFNMSTLCSCKAILATESSYHKEPDIKRTPMTSPTEKVHIQNSSQTERKPEYKQQSTNTQYHRGTSKNRSQQKVYADETYDRENNSRKGVISRTVCKIKDTEQNSSKA